MVGIFAIFIVDMAEQTISVSCLLLLLFASLVTEVLLEERNVLECFFVGASGPVDDWHLCGEPLDEVNCILKSSFCDGEEDCPSK